MTTQASTDTGNPIPDTVQVAEYLRNQPEFFLENPELLTELRLSHPSGKAISLIERQVQVLREQNKDLKHRLLELVDVARDNDRVNERMHSLMMDLLGAGTLLELLDRLEDHLRSEFKADAVSILLASVSDTVQRETAIGKLLLNDAEKKLFAGPLTENKPLCGRLRQEQLEFLFGDQALAIESSAVIPIGDKAPVGMLAIGSREVNRFHCNMGTLFLNHLGELLTRMLKQHNIG
jgi:uncharacterized protein YigA (DUF484 family)